MITTPKFTSNFVNTIMSMNPKMIKDSGFRQYTTRGLFHNLAQNFGVRQIATRIVLLTIFSCALGGCMSMKPVDLSREEVREQVRAGKIVRPGDHISITREDGRTADFEVAQVTDQAVKGDGTEVPIDSIVSLRTRQLDRTRSALVVVGTAAVVYAAAAVNAMNEILDDILGQ